MIDLVNKMANFESRVREIGFHAYVREIETEIVEYFIARQYKNRSQMAEDMKMHRTTLIEKMRALGLEYEPLQYKPQKKATG